MNIKTRFAPSPTGNLHIGSIRTALYSWLFAKRYNGNFILRIEDTDLIRSQSNAINSILNGLRWLGLHWDEGPYFQTKRLNRYKSVINNMLERGDAYICICSSEKLQKIRIEQIEKGYKPRYPGTCRNLRYKNIFDRSYVIRFKNPLYGKVIFQDKIRGKIIFDNEELDDLVIQRSNGIPTYNFCVVIDDLDMKITHVIRGEDHINNTPRQINILQSLSARIPVYAHLSMILDEQGQKISKRNNALNIMQYRKNGFLSEALLNYVIRLGWSYGDKEIFNMSEMKKLFNLSSISKSASSIDMKKLLWINKYYINHLSLDKIVNLLYDYMKEQNIDIKYGPDLNLLLKLFRNRCYTLKEIIESSRYFYEDFNSFNQIAAKKYLIPENYSILKESYKIIDELVIWNNSNISKMIDNLSCGINIQKKEINMVLRVAITGDVYSPAISNIIYLMGKKKTLLRVKKAMNYINNIINNKIESK